MHEFVAQDRRAAASVAEWITARLSALPAPAASSSDPLPLIERHGIGTEAAWTAVRDLALPTAFPTDHPRYLAFVGGAPTPAAVLTDAALSAAAIYAGSELEAGAVAAAEQAAVRWLTDLIGYDDAANGTFVSGGSIANLSALVAARHGRIDTDSPPNLIIVGASAHASITAAAVIMGCRVVTVGAEHRRLRAADLAPVLAGTDPDRIVAVVTSAGATNTGAVDDLAAIADLCAEHGAWLHVDAAYGGAALLSPPHRALLDGIDRADSVTIDPHKWLFTPFDCAAVLYRDGAHARAAHQQRAPYLDVVNDDQADNPADYAVHLTRRARGLPLWASLIAYGTDAYVDAVERCLATAQEAAKAIEGHPYLSLVGEPQLSVVLFRRDGWDGDDYQRWSDRVRRTHSALVTPTRYDDETVLRLCFVNPRTTALDVEAILDSLDSLDSLEADHP